VDGVIYFGERFAHGREIRATIFGSVLLCMGIYRLLNLVCPVCAPHERNCGNDFVLGTVGRVRVSARFGDPSAFDHDYFVVELRHSNLSFVAHSKCMSRDALFARRARQPLEARPSLAFSEATPVSLFSSSDRSRTLIAMAVVFFVQIILLT